MNLLFGRTVLGAALVWVLCGSPMPARAHGDEEGRVAVELVQEGPQTAGDLSLTFDLLDLGPQPAPVPAPAPKPVTDADLNETHTKKLHVFVFDVALKEFRHEHPEYKNGKWNLQVKLPVNGSYRIWTQGELAVDGEEFTSSAKLIVKDGKPANPVPEKLGDIRAGNDGVSKVTLQNKVIREKKMIMLDLNFSRTDGKPAELTPYLGALAHVVATSSDSDSLLHVHPMDHGVPNQLMLHAVFPEKGEYRLWVQFMDRGELKVVPLSVEVVK